MKVHLTIKKKLDSIIDASLSKLVGIYKINSLPLKIAFIPTLLYVVGRSIFHRTDSIVPNLIFSACMGIVVYIAAYITLKPLGKLEDDISALKDYDFSYKSKYYTQDQFEDIFHLLNDSKRHVKKDFLFLEGAVDDINNYIKRFSSIADQTNLLALNASIEAEKGFAVVAEEIRSLQEVMEQIHSLAAIAEENSASCEEMSTPIVQYSQ